MATEPHIFIYSHMLGAILRIFDSGDGTATLRATTSGSQGPGKDRDPPEALVAEVTRSRCAYHGWDIPAP